MTEPLFPGKSPKYTSVLVVDDDADLLSLVELVLNKEKFQVTTAMNADEALSQLGQSEFDLIICDIMMPSVNGLELIKRIREEDKFAEIPTIMLTSCPIEEFEMPAIVSGADVFCEKARLRKDLMKQIELLLG